MPSPVSYLVSFLFLSKTDMSFFFSLSRSLSLSVLLFSLSLLLFLLLSHSLVLFLYFTFFFLFHFNITSILPYYFPCYSNVACLCSFSLQPPFFCQYFIPFSFPSLPHPCPPPPPPLFFCLPILSHSLFPPPHLPSFSPFSFCSSFIDRIISKMPGIFLTV